jgi:hypothetical protein
MDPPTWRARTSAHLTATPSLTMTRPTLASTAAPLLEASPLAERGPRALRPLRAGGLPLVTCALVLSLLGCRCWGGFSWDKPGAPLLDGFVSYSSQASMSGGDLQGHDLEVVKSSPCRPGDPRPCFEISVVRTDFEHLGCPGDLLLTFFEDRLYATTFYPKDFERYLRLLRESGIDLPRRSEPLELSRFTRVWAAADDSGREYVAWRDQRLFDEHARWLVCTSDNHEEVGGEPSDGFGPSTP